jgi:arginyl-tRNA synthetase
VFQDIERRIIAAAEASLARKFNLSLKVQLEQPKQTSFGELAIPVAFQLARELKKAPKAIAEELVADMGPVRGVAAFEIAGNGFINVRLDRAAYAATLLERGITTTLSGHETPKTIVEHTNINPNKAAHIGHLRNAILGDTFVRMLRCSGERVEVQNYIDNTGVQVADVVVGFHFLEKKTLTDVQALIASTERPFDYHCWDLYARVSSYYSENAAALKWRAEVLHAIEAGEGEVAELAHVIADAIVKAHLKTMYRLGIEYDVLPRESEILHLQFWATAFELLKQRQAIFFETEGKNKGCWVMPASAFKATGGKQKPSETDAEPDDEDKDDSKVIVRSNGTVTYVGKDIAYQLWKFGLLGKDFYYKPWAQYPDGHEVWVSTDQPVNGSAPHFGGGREVYNVIDSRQSYLQDVVVAGLRALGFNDQADRSVHFSYEMVALSPRTCTEMGIQLSDEDKKKPYVEVAGRKGLGVKADDLLDKLIETAQAEVDDRHPEAHAAERREVAEIIAVGALRYFMLKFTRNSVIAFDFHEALSFEGETGPYALYSVVRAGNILKKYEERFGALPDFEKKLTPAVLARLFDSEDLWQLVLLVSKVDHAVRRAIQAGEPAHIAKYAFQSAQAFNTFYHDYQVINESDIERREALVWMTSFFRERLIETLGVLGIQQPKYM